MIDIVTSQAGHGKTMYTISKILDNPQHHHYYMSYEMKDIHIIKRVHTFSDMRNIKKQNISLFGKNIQSIDNAKDLINFCELVRKKYIFTHLVLDGFLLIAYNKPNELCEFINYKIGKDFHLTFTFSSKRNESFKTENDIVNFMKRHGIDYFYNQGLLNFTEVSRIGSSIYARTDLGDINQIVNMHDYQSFLNYNFNP